MAPKSTEFLFSAKAEFIKGSAEGSTRPRVYLLAYTGSPLRLANYDAPVVIDMASVSFASDRLPIVADHEYGIDSIRLGYTTSQKISDVVEASGIITSQTREATQMVADAKDGIPFQVSVGAAPGNTYPVAKGRSVYLNGRSYDGPIIVAEDTVIRELSIVLLGADNQTVARIAASLKRGVTKMTYDEFVQSLGMDPKEITAEQDTTLKATWTENQQLARDKAKLERDNTKLGGDLKAALAVEPPKKKKPEAVPTIAEIEAAASKATTDAIVAAETRATAIKATFAKYGDVDKVEVDGKDVDVSAYRIDSIQAGADPRDIELTLLRASRVPASFEGFNVNTLPASGNMDIRHDAICASIMAGVGAPESHVRRDGKEVGLKSMFSEKVLEASQSKDLRNMTLHQLFDQVIRATGGHYNGNRSSNEFIRAGFEAEQKIIQADGAVSTLGVTSILEDTANKTLLQSYGMQNTVW
ncbi:MAG: hypothetical protein DRJ50_14825, partial [Actinobacteria bacterium]